jgi:hypothetical protein
MWFINFLKTKILTKTFFNYIYFDLTILLLGIVPGEIIGLETKGYLNKNVHCSIKLKKKSKCVSLELAK